MDAERGLVADIDAGEHHRQADEQPEGGREHDARPGPRHEREYEEDHDRLDRYPDQSQRGSRGQRPGYERQDEKHGDGCGDREAARPCPRPPAGEPTVHGRSAATGSRPASAVSGSSMPNRSERA